MRRKYKKVYTTLNYMKHFFVLASTVTGCVSIFAFASLFGISVETTSSAIGLKIGAIAAGIKKYKSIINKENKKHDKMLLLAKTNLNMIVASISKALIDSNISHDEFILTNNALKVYGDLKEEIENLKT